MGHLWGRITNLLRLAASAGAIGAMCFAHAELPDVTQLNSHYDVISERNARDCDKFDVRAPRPDENKSDAYFQGRINACWQVASDPTKTGIDQGAATLNVAKLHFYRAEQNRSATPQIAAQSYISALEAIARSERTLPDTASSLNANGRDGRERALFKLERAQLKAMSLLRLGFMDPARVCATASNGNCLQAGIQAANQPITNIVIPGRPARREDDSLPRRGVRELRYASALALRTIGGTANLEQALNNFRELAQGNGNTSHLASEARVEFVQTALKAGRALTEGTLNTDRLSNAARLIERAASMAEQVPGFDAQAIAARRELGDIYTRRAGLYAGSGNTQQQIYDLCLAAPAFDRAAVVAGAASQTAQQYMALESKGGILVQLNALKAPGCTNGNLSQETVNARRNDGIQAFEQARALRSGLGEPYEADYTRDLATLYQERGEEQKAFQLFREASAAGGAVSAAGVRSEVEANVSAYNRSEQSLADTEAALIAIAGRAPGSPIADLARGRLLVADLIDNLGSTGGNGAVYQRASQALQSAAARAREKPEYAAERVEALYLLSKAETVNAAQLRRSGVNARPNVQAADWAIEAAISGNGDARYTHQACRALLMVARSAEHFAQANSYCATSDTSPDGRMLRALNAFRQAQLPPNSSRRGRLRAAEDAFDQGVTQLTPELRRSTFKWPEMANAEIREQLLTYGEIRARACAAVQGENVSPPSYDPQTNRRLRDILELYGAYQCRINKLED